MPAASAGHSSYAQAPRTLHWSLLWAAGLKEEGENRGPHRIGPFAGVQTSNAERLLLNFNYSQYDSPGTSAELQTKSVVVIAKVKSSIYKC